MLAVLATIILMMPWILGTLREYTATLFQNLAAYGLHG
jgi:flagellar biosynthesis protein FliQ